MVRVISRAPMTRQLNEKFLTLSALTFEMLIKSFASHSLGMTSVAKKICNPFEVNFRFSVKHNNKLPTS